MVDYFINNPEIGEIIIETADAGPVGGRMKAYYVNLMAPHIESKLDEKSKKELLTKIVSSLDADEIAKRISDVENEDKKAAYVSVLQELVDAYEDEDLDEYESIEVDGNIFTFKRGLDITPFMNLFKEVASDTKGNKWMVEIDSEGKAVLFE